MVIVVCFATDSAPSGSVKRAQLAGQAVLMSFANRWDFLGISWNQLSIRKHGVSKIVGDGHRDKILTPRWDFDSASPKMPVSAIQSGRQLFEFGPFRVDPEKQTLVRDGKSVALTPKAFQLLLALLRHCNQTVTKDELMKLVWPDTFVEETNLTRNIFALRQALGGTEENHYIITVPGKGYRLAGDVRLVLDGELSLVAATSSTVQVKVEEKSARRSILLVAVTL